MQRLGCVTCRSLLLIARLLGLHCIVELAHLLVDALLEGQELVLITVKPRQGRVVPVHAREQLTRLRFDYLRAG